MAHLIDKDALVAEIERRIKAYQKNFDKADNKIAKLSTDGRIQGLKALLSFLDSIEVKEVDLEKEIKEEYLKRRQWGGKLNMLVILNEPQFNEIAKHFFELGLKAQKGEEV